MWIEMKRTVQLAYSGRHIVVVGIQLRNLEVLVVVGCIQQIRGAYGKGNSDSLHDHCKRVQVARTIICVSRTQDIL